MALSKPRNLILQLTSAYFERLYTSPVKTKAITRYVIININLTLIFKLYFRKILFIFLVVLLLLSEISCHKKFLV